MPTSTKLEWHMNVLLALLFFLVAVLYAAVGQGGGSGYLAVMGLVGLPAPAMKPTALALNVLVAAIGTWKYYRAGHFAMRLFWPFAVTSVPFAFLGGRLSLPGAAYQRVVGLILLYAAFRLGRRSDEKKPTSRRLAVVWPLLAGGAIGFLSGLVGVGGGIFLGPLLLLAGWATTRTTMSITAAFVLVNSAAGLMGYVTTAAAFPPALGWWLLVAAAGGWLGAEVGSRRLDPLMLNRLLALVLVVGGLRMLLS